jgi:hypothetical protein
MFFEPSTSPIAGEFTGLESNLSAGVSRLALLSHLYQDYQIRYVLVHGALARDGSGGFAASRPEALSAVVQAATSWLPDDFDTLSGRMNLPTTINDTLRRKSPCTRVLALPEADLKLVERRRDWWWRSEYVGMTSILSSLGDLPRAVMGDSFDEVITLLLLEARTLARLLNVSVQQAVEATVRKAFEQSGVELRERVDYPSESCRFQLLLTTYALLAHPDLSPAPFMEALTTLPKQAPFDYFTDTTCINWRGEDGFRQLVYEALMFPFALECERMKADTSSTFVQVQRFKKALRFVEDVAIFLPRVQSWLAQLD